MSIISLQSSIEKIYEFKVLKLPHLISHPESSNSSYFFHTKRGDFVLKKYKPTKTEHSIAFEHRVIQEVSKNFAFVQEIECPKFSVSSNNLKTEESYFVYRDSIYCLFHWTDDKPFDGSTKQLEHLGSNIADFFTVLDELKTEKNVNKKFDFKLNESHCKEQIIRFLNSQKNIGVIPGNGKLLNDSIGFYNELLAQYEKVIHSLPVVIIHGDLSPNNIGFKENCGVSKIRDFEFVRYSYRFFDIGWALVSFCNDKLGVNQYKMETFISSLSKKYNLNEDILQLSLLSVIYRVIKYIERSLKKLIDKNIPIQEVFFNEHICYLKSVLVYLRNKNSKK